MSETEQKDVIEGMEFSAEWRERAREMLIAQGRLLDFEISDIPEDHLREIVQNMRRRQGCDAVSSWECSTTMERGATRWKQDA